MTMMNKVTFDGEQIPQEQLIKAAGWRIAIAPIHISKQTSSGIHLPNDVVKGAEHMRFVGKVISMGPLCYKHDKFKEHPSAAAVPWCKLGDIVSTSQYAGTTVPCKHGGKEFSIRMVNDEEIVSIIPDISILNV